jgi:hypothetical protein
MAGPGVPVVTDRATWQAELDALRVLEKAHTHSAGALLAGRRARHVLPGVLPAAR